MAANASFTSRKIRAKDVFQAYFLEHHEEDLVALFEAEDEEQHYPVFINFLTLFEAHVEVAESLLSRPVRLLPVLDTGLLCAARELLERLGRETPGRTLKLNLHARIIGVPNCPELHRAAVPRTCDVGRLLCVSGTVVRTTPVKMLEYRKDFVCAKCKHVFSVEADHDQYYQLPRPTHCLRPIPCPSTAISPITSTHPVHTKDYQEIKIQEQVQKLEVGTIPRSLWVTLEDDLVDTCQPGDDVLLCGSVHRRWRGTVRDVRPDIDLVLKANNVTVRNKQRSGTVVTDEMREEFTDFWQQYQHDPLTGRNIVLASLCPQIYGLYVVKLAVAVVVAGGVQRTTNTSTSIRGSLISYLWETQVLADGGICCIDEFSSVREADRAAIHEAMEQQTISVAKAGLVCKLNTRCSVIAATNPKGEYDPEESLTINTALASPLLSRFDLILVLLDMKNPEWDKVVSDYILQGRDPLKGDGGSMDDWSLEKLQAYFCHVRTLQPTMTPYANAILSRYYQLQRQADNNNKARTTIRLLESLVRLSQGHARLMMRTEVGVVDAVVAVQLMEASMSGTAVITGINPLHTSFPASPAAEYKKHVKVVMQKLGLFDVLTDEMKRLNEEEKLQASQRTRLIHANVGRENTCTTNTEDKVQQFQQRKEFRPLVREDAVTVSIEELEEGDQRRVGTQRTLYEMSGKNERTSVNCSDTQKQSHSMESDNLGSAKIRSRKGSKRKGESNVANSDVSQSRNKRVKAKKTKVREFDDCVESPSGNAQELVDKAGDALLEELEDFESLSSRSIVFSQKNKGSFSSGIVFKKKGPDMEGVGHSHKLKKHTDVKQKSCKKDCKDKDDEKIEAESQCKPSSKEKSRSKKTVRDSPEVTEMPCDSRLQSKDLGWLKKFSYVKSDFRTKYKGREGQYIAESKENEKAVPGHNSEIESSLQDEGDEILSGENEKGCDGKDDSNEREREHSASPDGPNNSFISKLKQFTCTSNSKEDSPDDAQTPGMNQVILTSTIHNLGSTQKSVDRRNYTQSQSSDVNEQASGTNEEIDDDDADFFDIQDTAGNPEMREPSADPSCKQSSEYEGTDSPLSGNPEEKHGVNCEVRSDTSLQNQTFQGHKENGKIDSQSKSLDSGVKKQKRSCFALTNTKSITDSSENSASNKVYQLLKEKSDGSVKNRENDHSAGDGCVSSDSRESERNNRDKESKESGRGVFENSEEHHLEKDSLNGVKANNKSIHSGQSSEKLLIASNKNGSLNLGNSKQSQSVNENSKNKKRILGNLVLPFRKPTFSHSSALTSSKTLNLSKFRANLESGLTDDLDDIDFDL